MKTYSEKLKDPRWQRKRLEIMQRDGFRCQSCHDTDSTLHVHHWKYSGDPWESSSKDLMTLCASCHHRAEDEIAAIKHGFTWGADSFKFLLRFLSKKRNLIMRYDDTDHDKFILIVEVGDDEPAELATLIKKLQRRLSAITCTRENQTEENQHEN